MAIDCMTFAYAKHHAGAQVAGLRAPQWTDAAPGLPLIGSSALTVFQVAELQEVLDALRPAQPDLMAELALKGFSKVPLKDHQVIAKQEAAAKRLAYGLVARKTPLLRVRAAAKHTGGKMHYQRRRILFVWRQIPIFRSESIQVSDCSI